MKPNERRTAGAVSEEAPLWLSAQEKEAWTGLVSLVLLLPGWLESDLMRRAALTLFEYLTLSHISEMPGRKLRMGELAYLASGSPSRLSNVVRRLETRGLVTRSPDPANGRYTLAALTEAGNQTVLDAAPWHLRSVRSRVLDHLDTDDQQSLIDIASKLGARRAESTPSP
ncbi:MAG: MarR family transcriptional regulator [Pseudonocardiales bacterium]|nr:MarR family transcriptional regulator [Pseudonocardiales bacterium]